MSIQHKLYPREWATLTVVFGFFLFLSVLVQTGKVPPSPKESIKPFERDKIEVTLRGIEKAPISCRCIPGTSLKELLKNNGLSPKRRGKKGENQKILYHSQEIFLREVGVE